MQRKGSSAEIELVEEVARGSEAALSALYDRYCRLVYGQILATLNDPRDAEEVLQEVFLQVWNQARRFDRRKGSVYRWLVILARSRAIDRIRSRNFTRRREMEAPLEPLEPADEPRRTSQLDAVLMQERADMVREKLGVIPEAQQQVMRLAYYLGFTQSEIARKLGIPLGTVKTRMRDGLMALQDLLAGEHKL